MKPRFVGRRAELTRLRELLRESREGNGRLVTIAGEAGIGKTRLAAEIANVATDQGFSVLWSQMIEDPVAPPYTAWLLGLRGYLQQVDDDTLRTELGSGATFVADILPELRDRLRLAPSHQATESEGAARFQLYDSVSRLLLAVAKRQPVMLLFDNLHLADQSSLSLLEYFARQLTRSAALVIAAYRSGERAADSPFEKTLAALNGIADSEQIELAGLTRDEVGELLRTALGKTTLTLIDTVYTRGDGNPLFTCQVATNLSRQLEGSGRASTDGALAIPNSLAEVIAARLATVPSEVLDVLRNAAVLGRDFENALLSQVSGTDVDVTSRFMEEATDSGLVVYLGPGRYRFVHALFRETLYSQHSSEQRLRLHRAAATCLSQRYRDAADPPVAQLAYHWFEASRGSFDPEAIAWCYRAARAAIAKRAYGEAIVQIEHALALIDLGDNEDPVLRFELLSTLGAAQYQAGQQGLSNLAWLRAALLAQEQGWAIRLANAVLQWQYIRAATGLSHGSAVSLHDAALEMLPADSDALRTRVLASKALAYRYRDEHERAYATLDEALRLARNIGDPEVIFDCLIKAFYLFAPAYDAPTRLTMLEEAVTLAPHTGREENLLLASAALFFPLSSLGRFDDMRARLEELAEKAEAARHNFWRQLVAGFRVEIAILEGRWGEALKVAQRSLEQGALEGATGVEGRFGFQVFTIYRALGALDAIAPLLSRLANAEGETRTWLPGLCLLRCELGQKPEAIDALEQLGDVRELIPDDLYETTLVYLADACAWLGDRTRCRQLYDLLKPYRGYNLTLLGTIAHGAASGYLAKLARVLRREAGARELFEEALKLNASMGAPPILASTRTDYAELLLTRDLEKDRARGRKLLSQARASADRLGMRTLLRRIDALVSEGATQDQLSNRELEVLHLIAGGASNKRIADQLHISVPTVATHVRNILRKTSTRNRIEAATYARSCGLLPSD